MGAEEGSRDRFHSFKKKVADRLPEDLAKKWEARMRERTIERKGYIPINDLMTYHLEEKYPGELAVHVNEIFTKSPREMAKLAIQGLREVARLLETDPSLAHVTHVVGASWIVFDNPGIAEVRGFTVVERKQKQKISVAKMTREKFIARYGTTSRTGEGAR